MVEPLPKHCPGCPKEIPVDSPELKEALGHSVAQLNAENNHTFYFKIDTVRRATSQVCKQKDGSLYPMHRLIGNMITDFGSGWGNSIWQQDLVV